MSSFGGGLVGAATLLPVFLQLVPRGVRLVSRVVLFIPEPSSAVSESLVRIYQGRSGGGPVVVSD